MKRKPVSTRIFAFILVIAMIVTIVPMTALAGDSDAVSRTQTEYADAQNAAGNVALQEEAEAADQETADEPAPAETAAPEPATAAPEPTTAAPEPATTAAPEPTTAAPEPATAAPEEPTAAPEPTTAAPEPATAAPEEPTAAQEPVTAAPEEPTAAPEPTAVPEEPTAAPEETTAASEELTEEETTEAEEEDAMPAQDFFEGTNNVEVSVKAPQGAFPDKTRMVVKDVPKEAVLDAVREALDSEVSDMRAVDITFYNKEGEEIHPLKEIRVVLRAPGMDVAPEAARDVVHIDDYGTAEVINDANITGTKAVFNTDEFSIYVIADGEQTETYRRTYQFLNEIDTEGQATPYTFYNKAGELVDNQIIKDGDELEPVGTPFELGKTFLGWFLAEESEGSYQYTDEQVAFETAISLSLTADETVYVAPKYESVYYVTFHETLEGADDDIIQTKKVVYTSGSDANKVLISDVIAPQLDAEHIFYGWSYDGTNYTIYDSDSQIKETYIEDIESDIDLYPFFTEAYWLRFVSAEHGANATYIESRFVLAEDVITTLPVPTRKGYEFEGWYTGSQDDEENITYDEQITDETGAVVDPAGLKLTQSLTLYGKWDEDTATTYNVVFWKQKVTDDKNAAPEDKTYDYWDSEVRNGLTGADIEVTSEDTGRTETGFHYARYTTTSATVSADGNTTVNVYYDRDLVSVNFYYRNNVPGSDTAYEYTPTTNENMPPQQYGLLEDGTYVPLQKTNLPPITRVYYTYSSWGRTLTYTGTFYIRSGPWYNRVYTATEYNGNNPPPTGGTTYWGYTNALLNDGYSELTRREETIAQSAWSYQMDGETIPYTGTRYTRREVQGYNHMITFTGLYGQSFDHNGYQWPANYRWYEEQYGQGTGQTFLIDFTKGDVYNLYENGNSGNYNIYHYKQGLNGRYNQDEAYIAKVAGNNVQFHFENKFDGFTVTSYSGNFNANGTGTDVSPGSQRNVTCPIYVYHERSKHQIDYNVEGSIKHSETGIYFEAPLDAYDLSEEDAPYVEKEHYIFTGWYADETCTKPFDFSSTMPNGNLVLYAGYAVEKYDVNVDPDGGVITAAIGATHFSVEYNEKINRYNGVERNYIEDPEGGYKYVINFTDTARTATYEPAEDGYTGTRYRPITASDPQYSLIGWYEVIDGALASTPYDFDEPVTQDIVIRAVWKLSGAYRVQYTPVTTVDGVPVSGDISIPQKEIDAQYADRSEIIVQKGPTNVTAGYVFDGWQVVSAVDGDVLDDNGGNYYQTGDEMMIHASWADSGRMIHLQAHYTKVDESTDPVAITKLIFDANGGELTEAPAIVDKNGNTCTPTVESNTAKYDNLPINQDYALSQINDKVTREGFDLIGWNTDKDAADSGEVEFGLDVTIGVDELDSNTNTLYACWSRVVSVELTGSELSKEYNGAKQENAGYTVKYMVGDEEVTELPSGVTATFSSTGDNDGDDTNLKAVGKDTGTYTTTVKVVLTSTNPAYQISTTKGTAEDDLVLEITPAAVTITVADDEKEYGEEDPAFADAEIEGGFGTDLEDIDLSVSRTNTEEDAGLYEGVLNIGKTEEELNEAYPNYTFTIEPGDFEIKKATMTVEAVDYEGEYDGAEHEGGATPSVTEGTTILYSLDGGETWTEDVPDIKDVGTVEYKVKATNPNYADATDDGTLKVTPAAVTITVADDEKEYGEEDPAFADAEIEGGFGTDLEDIDLSVSRTNTEEDAGLYEGVLNIGQTEEELNEAYPNYTFTIEPGDFEIKKATMTVEAVDYEGEYDGAEHEGGATPSVTEGTTILYSLDGGETWTEDVPDIKDVGTVDYKVKATNPNYADATDDGTLKVTPAAVTITVADDEKEYGEEDPDFADAEIEGGFGTDLEDVDLSVSRTNTEEDAGLYEGVLNIGQTEEELNEAYPNYTFTIEPGDFEINPKEVTVTADPAEKTYGDPDPETSELSATVEGLKDGDTIDYTLKLGDHAEDAGTYTGCVTVTGDTEQGNYKITYKNGDFTIKKAALKITAKKQSYVYNGEEQGPAEEAYEDPAEIAEVVDVEGLCLDDQLTGIVLDGQGKDVGEYDLVPSQAELDNADNYEIEYVDGILEITPLDVIVTITGNTDTQIYDGEEHQVEGYDTEISDPLYTEDDFTFSGEAAVKGTDPDEYPMGLAEDQFKNTNVNFNVTFEVTDGWLLIIEPEQIVVIIKAATKTELYDGTQKQINDYEVTIPEDADFTAADVIHEGEATAKGTDAGTYEMGLAPEQFNVEKTKFDVIFQVTDGKLIIKKRTVRLTSDSASKEYDGTALEKPEVTVTGDGFVDGEVSGLKATGSIIKVGTADNTITYTEGEAFKADNYEITKKEGTLEITQNTSDIRITSGDDSKKYDGKALTCDEAEVTGLPEGFTYEVEVTGSITDAGEKANTIKSFKIFNEDGEDVTDQFANIELTEGTLTVEKRDVTLTSATDKKLYDGTALTNDEITVGGDGWADGEGAVFNVTGSQTYVGSSENTFTYQLNGGAKVLFANLLSAEKIAATKEGNYNIEKVYGTLTVTDENADASVQKTHNGDEFKAGDVVEFEITAENIYDENKTITFTEQEGVTITSDSVFKDVKPGKKVTATAEYTITEEDVAKGSFKNTAEVTFSGVDKVYEATDTVNTGKEDPHLTIDKKTTSKPANGKAYVLGEKITYKITVTNDGNVPVEDITIEDPLTGDSWTIKVLKPGESKVFTTSYVVTEADVKKGTVHNEATAKTKKDIPVTPGTADVPTSPTGGKTPSGKAPKTGDNNPLALWLIILLLSGATIGGQFVMRRSRRRED